MSYKIYDRRGQTFEIKTYLGKVKKVYIGSVVQVKICNSKLDENYRVGYVHSVVRVRGSNFDQIVIYTRIDEYRFSGEKIVISECNIVNIRTLLKSI